MFIRSSPRLVGFSICQRVKMSSNDFHKIKEKHLSDFKTSFQIMSHASFLIMFDFKNPSLINIFTWYFDTQLRRIPLNFT